MSTVQRIQNIRSERSDDFCAAFMFTMARAVSFSSSDDSVATGTTSADDSVTTGTTSADDSVATGTTAACALAVLVREDQQLNMKHRVSSTAPAVRGMQVLTLGSTTNSENVIVNDA
jgi:hypothetical protein